MNIKITNPIGVVITVLLVTAAFLAGSRVGSKSNTGLPGTNGVATITPTIVPPTQEKTDVTVSIDDDPILGDKNKAKIAIVEFSDYECPYCKKYVNDTMGLIKKNYVETGKAIYVFRDLPLSFHDPAATKDARAAECVRSLSNDATYYKMHDLLFANTAGNGGGISDDKLAQLAVSLGVDRTKYLACINSDEFNSEIKKDISDATAAGIGGTPGFVVGKLSADGNVTGTLISGAYPYATFSEAIEALLR